MIPRSWNFVKTLVAVFLLVISAVAGRAEDWFVKGKVYTNVHVTKVNPDTVSVDYDGGTGRLALVDLPPDIAKRFAAAAKKAQAFAELEKKAETDPIDRLIVRLSGDSMWLNGGVRPIRLPPTASAQDLVTAYDNPYPGPGYVKTATLLEWRDVQIDPFIAPYTAVRIRTAEGDKIILFQYQGSSKGIGLWWNKEFRSGF
jgi:hypothetical protein